MELIGFLREKNVVQLKQRKYIVETKSIQRYISDFIYSQLKKSQYWTLESAPQTNLSVATNSLKIRENSITSQLQLLLL